MKKNSHTNGSGALFRRMLLIFAFGSGSLAAQTFTESMGSVASTTSIVSYEAANGFDNDGFTMTGNADIRNTSASNGYAGASGLANVFFTNNTTNPAGNRSFQIEGINTSNISDPVLSFGILKSTVASDGSDFIVEVSTDGINYTPVSFPALPTGTGTAVWRYETVTGAIPQVSDLRIRWTNTSATTQYRIDDVNLNCSASITPSQSTTLCAGDNVTLTASNALGGSYLWSNSAATQSISAGSSATYTVQVTDGSGCVSVSSPVRVLAYPAAMVSASASDSTICTGDSATLHARTLTQDLIFSEYVEGSGNEKYIEIYNGTGAAVNLSDYEYLAFHNGAASPSFTTALSGTLADGATLVLKNGSATLYSGGQAEFGVQHNGNDALALYKISTSSYVDIFGVIGQDPGTAWTGPGGYSTMDHTLRRKPNVYSGITVNPGLAGANGFTTLTTEWDLYATDDVSGLGMHSVDGAYVWNPGSYSGNMVSVSPSSTTTYTVTGTFINGCTASDDVTINVSNPSVSVSASDTLIYLCYGPQSSTLTANASGGTAPYSISWSTGETTSSVTVSPNTTTTYSVTVSDNNGCTSSSSSIAV
ncbi:MAG TPA: lamin tail domain-containing protein, partial [Bacteroidia bacterium]|nr:lamin tail domain-containing protein [Bacteroidia bacterium]